MRTAILILLLGHGTISCSSSATAEAEASRDITITRVSIQQGVELALMKDGQEVLPSYAAPIAGRPGMVRVEFSPRFSGVHDVTAQLLLDHGGGMVATKEIVKQIDGSNSGQIVDFELAASDLLADTKFRVRFAPRKGGAVTGDGAPAEYPAKTSQPVTFKLQRSGTLRIKLIPVRYDADGSGRIADSDETHVQALKKRFMDLFPVTGVDIAVGDPFPWNGKLSRNGDGHDDLLDGIMALRAQEHPEFDVYYLGLFATTATYAEYCGRQCTTGLSVRVRNASSAESRVSVAVGYADTRSMDTSLHEIGHAHGQQHSPCGVGDPDPSFPHDNAALGAEGYAASTKTFYNPAKTFDLMSYCDPTWVSDYTFGAFLNRVQEVTRAVAPQQRLALGRPIRVLQVRANGASKWGQNLTIGSMPKGESITLTATAPDGKKTNLFGHKYPYVDRPGGTVWVASSDVAGKRVELDFDGAKIELDSEN